MEADKNFMNLHYKDPARLRVLLANFIGHQCHLEIEGRDVHQGCVLTPEVVPIIPGHRHHKIVLTFAWLCLLRKHTANNAPTKYIGEKIEENSGPIIREFPFHYYYITRSGRLKVWSKNHAHVCHFLPPTDGAMLDSMYTSMHTVSLSEERATYLQKLDFS
jgi:hypothetical protein